MYQPSQKKKKRWMRLAVLKLISHHFLLSKHQFVDDMGSNTIPVGHNTDTKRRAYDRSYRLSCFHCLLVARVLE